MAHEDIAAGIGGRRTEELPLQQPYRRATSDQRPLLLLPLLLALVLLSVSSVCSKYVASRGAGGGPNDSDSRCALLALVTSNSSSLISCRLSIITTTNAAGQGVECFSDDPYRASLLARVEYPPRTVFLVCVRVDFSLSLKWVVV